MTDEERAEVKYQEHINKEDCYISNSEEKIYTDGYLDGLAEGRKENAELKAEIKNYADVINRLMGTPLTETEEIGRLIAIAQYRNWGDL